MVHEKGILIIVLGWLNYFFFAIFHSRMVKMQRVLADRHVISMAFML